MRREEECPCPSIKRAIGYCKICSLPICVDCTERDFNFNVILIHSGTAPGYPCCLSEKERTVLDEAILDYKFLKSWDWIESTESEAYSRVVEEIEDYLGSYHSSYRHYISGNLEIKELAETKKTLHEVLLKIFDTIDEFDFHPKLIAEIIHSLFPQRVLIDWMGRDKYDQYNELAMPYLKKWATNNLHDDDLLLSISNCLITLDDDWKLFDYTKIDDFSQSVVDSIQQFKDPFSVQLLYSLLCATDGYFANRISATGMNPNEGNHVSKINSIIMTAMPESDETSHGKRWE